MNGSAVPDDETKISQILEAAARHDNASLEQYLKQHKFDAFDAVDAQNAQGTSPLHAAIIACGDGIPHGESNAVEEAGCDTVRLLLENGAIWNQLDNNGETPGCIAFRLGLNTLYELMVDAGVRAEILLNRLDAYEILADDEEEAQAQDETNLEQDETVPTLIDTTQHTVDENVDVNSKDYLSSSLVFTRDKLLDEQQNGVMMAWESDIMKTSVDTLLTKPGMKILNIGAGMMIFDTFVQDHENKPEVHHIVEAHSDVLTNMEQKGWDKKPGVTIHPGRWQEILPELVAENQTFDAIYYDTFAESYSDFKEFFSEYVLALLESDGRWSFFNGMGADRQISYDVYQKVAELDLFEAGFDVEWHDIQLPTLDKEWDGVKRSYWNIKSYRHPVCKFIE